MAVAPGTGVGVRLTRSGHDIVRSAKSDTSATRLRPAHAGRTRKGERVRPAFFLPLRLVAETVPYGVMLRLLTLALLLGATGCAPRLSPPYSDYEVRGGVDSTLVARLGGAATEAGWELVLAPTSGVVATAPRLVDEGLISRTEAALDLVPFDGGFVRIYVRAERRSFLGGRTKVYALSPDLRSKVLASLTEALQNRGLVVLGTPRDRDEDATE